MLDIYVVIKPTLYITNSDLFIYRLNNILENLSHCWNQSDYITHGYIKRERIYPIKHQIIFLAKISTKKEQFIKLYYLEQKVSKIFFYKRIRICFCQSVPKNLDKLLTDIVLLYNIASHMSWEGLYLFWGSVPTTSQDKSPIEKNYTPQKKTFVLICL